MLGIPIFHCLKMLWCLGDRNDVVTESHLIIFYGPSSDFMIATHLSTVFVSVCSVLFDCSPHLIGVQANGRRGGGSTVG